MAVCLTGCATVNCKFELKKDGSSAVDIQLLYDKEERNYFLTNVDSAVSDFIDEMNAEGYEVERYEDDEQISYNIHREYDNSSDLANSSFLSQNQVFSNFIEIQREDRFFYKKYRVEVILDSEIYEKWIPYTIKKVVADNTDVFVSITLPVNITKSNSNIESDSLKTAIWKLSIERENVLTLEQNIISMSTVIGAVLAAVLFVTAFCLYMIRRKK